MNFDELLQIVENSPSEQNLMHISGVPDEWSQGRTVFGGATVALAYQAIRKLIGYERVLRSISVNFVGPINAGEAFDIEPEVLREGRSVTHATAKIVQDGRVGLVCQACFGNSRESKIKTPNIERHDMNLPKKGRFIPQIPKVVPKFLRHFELALEKGMPFTGSKNKEVHGWVRFKQPPEKISDAHLLAMIDAWPPTLLQMLRWPAPASSVTWSVDFVHPHQPIKPDDWFAYQSDTRQASGGYILEEANIWDIHGELVAISRQTVTVFD
ncbi:thioesterase family protein [Paraneptunicella aestuarii]|uniref:acyl-CoA thioesterase n=1 Tax=Paraneptunicella aestuarii TaxID=2831148 RepID=UPI001E29031B|nr:thioesterase family protein [Paraneptunicella aestuarii]UAA39370.1 thioesterase family protein [Paraneptunicella aestuarii]